MIINFIRLETLGRNTFLGKISNQCLKGYFTKAFSNYIGVLRINRGMEAACLPSTSRSIECSPAFSRRNICIFKTTFAEADFCISENCREIGPFAAGMMCLPSKSTKLTKI